jgi:hypothetical protein
MGTIKPQPFIFNAPVQRVKHDHHVLYTLVSIYAPPFYICPIGFIPFERERTHVHVCVRVCVTERVCVRARVCVCVYVCVCV